MWQVVQWKHPRRQTRNPFKPNGWGTCTNWAWELATFWQWSNMPVLSKNTSTRSLLNLFTPLCLPRLAAIPNSTCGLWFVPGARQSKTVLVFLFHLVILYIFYCFFGSCYSQYCYYVGSNRVHVLVSEKTAVHLPVCEIHPGRSLHATLKKFMTVSSEME